MAGEEAAKPAPKRAKKAPADKPKKPAGEKAKKAPGDKAKKGDGPAAKRQKTSAAARQQQVEAPPPPQEVVDMEGQLVRDLAVMMYGFGDDMSPLPETLDLVEGIVLEYATTLLHKAMDSAAQRGRLRRPGTAGAGAAVGAEDILFLVRKDPKKYARAKELLIVDEEIRKARQTVEDVRDEPE